MVLISRYANLIGQKNVRRNQRASCAECVRESCCCPCGDPADLYQPGTDIGNDDVYVPQAFVRMRVIALGLGEVCARSNGWQGCVHPRDFLSSFSLSSLFVPNFLFFQFWIRLFTPADVPGTTTRNERMFITFFITMFHVHHRHPHPAGYDTRLAQPLSTSASSSRHRASLASSTAPSLPFLVRCPPIPLDPVGVVEQRGLAIIQGNCPFSHLCAPSIKMQEIRASTARLAHRPR
jgi:hypothetical protein